MRVALSDRSRVLGALVPVACAGLTAALLAVSLAGDGGERSVWPLGVMLLGAGVVALVWWRVRPGLVLAITAAVAVCYYLAGFPPGPETAPFVVALVAVAAAGHRVVAAVAALGAAAVAAGTDLVWNRAEDLGDLAAVAGTLAAVIALGEVYRVRRAYLAQTRQRAVEAERLRIARELHDVVSHQLAVINLQAEAALARHATRPELVLSALATISTASREALGDIRATLGAVRDPGGAAFDPAPSLADLPRLADRLRAAGTEVTTTIPEPPGPIPAAVERALVRIAQESLTNAARHARPRELALTVVYEPQSVVLEVVNDGVEASVREPGTGILGMRERAEALGGQLSAQVCADGRFRVRARLPWRAAP